MKIRIEFLKKILEAFQKKIPSFKRKIPMFDPIIIIIIIICRSLITLFKYIQCTYCHTSLGHPLVLDVEPQMMDIIFKCSIKEFSMNAQKKCWMNFKRKMLELPRKFHEEILKKFPELQINLKNSKKNSK